MWPQTIPEDLKKALEDLDGYRAPPTNQDRWGVIRDWLVSHGIEAPEDLPVKDEQAFGGGH